MPNQQGHRWALWLYCQGWRLCCLLRFLCWPKYLGKITTANTSELMTAQTELQRVRRHLPLSPSASLSLSLSLPLSPSRSLPLLPGRGGSTPATLQEQRRSHPLHRGLAAPLAVRNRTTAYLVRRLSYKCTGVVAGQRGIIGGHSVAAADRLVVWRTAREASTRQSHEKGYLPIRKKQTRWLREYRRCSIRRG